MDNYKLTDEEIDSFMRDLLAVLKVSKPGDRSDKDRVYAITITEAEKMYAYFRTFVIAGQVEQAIG